MGTVTVLAPIIVLVAFTLQGCLFSSFKPAVKIAIGHQCHDKVNKISDAAGLKDVHAAKACDEMDADLLNKFKVTNCKQVLHDMLHFVLAAACEYDVTMSAQGSCKPFSGAKCKTDVDVAVLLFPEGDTSQSDSNAEGPAEAEGTEALLGLVKQCSAVVKTAIASDSVQKIHAQNCDVHVDTKALWGVHVDKNAMSIMQEDAEHCEEYLEQQMTEIGTISCVAAAVTRDDAPQSPDAATSDWMEKTTKEFGENLLLDFYSTVEEGFSKISRLRLFQEMRQMKWPGKLSRWSPASVMAAWVASGLALVALLGVAWRRRSTCQSAPQDKPILDDELQLAE